MKPMPPSQLLELVLHGRTLNYLSHMFVHQASNAEWIEEKGFRYVDLSDSPDVTDLIGSDTGITVEMLQVHGQVDPHFHHRSQSAVLILKAPGRSELFAVVDGKGSWIPVRNEEVFPIPHDAVHGFRVLENHDPMLLLVLGWPAPEEDDVHPYTPQE